MNEIILNATGREAGRSQSRALRRERVVPGIYYFHGEESLPIAATELDLRPLIETSEQHLIRLKVDGESEGKLCILKDLDFDPITDRPTHFDLMGVAAGEKIKVEIPIVLLGRAAGQDEGGQVQFQQQHLDVEVLPKDMLEHIEVDISGLEIGDSVHVSDLDLGDVHVLTPDGITIVSVTPPRKVEEETVEEGLGLEEEIQEPELIGKGDSDEEKESEEEG